MERLSIVVQNPIATIGVGITGLTQSFFNWTTPMIQWLILVGTLIIIILNIINTFKKRKR